MYINCLIVNLDKNKKIYQQVIHLSDKKSMLNQIFSSSRPIGYILIAVGLFIAYCVNLFSDVSWMVDSYEIVKKIGLFFCIVLSVLLVQFISVKNGLNSNNLFSLFFYSCFLLLFSTYFDHGRVIVSNLFILLGLRRLLSMHSMRVLNQKIFDASLFILAASLFNTWSILFLILVYYSIIIYTSQDFRSWIIPLVAIVIVAILFYTYGLLTNLDFITYFQERFIWSFNFQYFENNFQRIALSIFAALSCLFIMAQAILYKRAPIHQHTLYKTILLCFIIGALVYIFEFPKYNASLVFTFFPLSIAAGNLVMNVEQKWVKELIMFGVLIISTIIFMMQL